MDSAIKVLFVFVISREISAQFIPKLFTGQCHKPVSIVEEPVDCCVIPDLYSVESVAGCGIDLNHKSITLSLRDSAACAQKTCLLRSQDMLFDNDDIDRESVKQYFEEWTENRKEFLPAVNAVKERCLGEKPLFGLPQMCPGDKLLFCIESTIYDKCPNWVNSEGCSALRSYLEDCMPYFS